MTDRIELRGLVASGYCGALPEEQQRPQPLEVDIDLHLDLAAATQSDALTDTVDYGALCAMVERVIVTERFTLLERLAERVAEVSLADDRATAVSVTVRKLRPPVSQQLSTAGVHLERSR
ncbi:MAG TPA: dihydroneopterin aldolase [Acidimicrobiales bacterium]|nr:dihydroneopterin aldolase [Acidimicrobiales bacterium]